MTKEDKVIYLANAAAISAVDGHVNPEEGMAIQCIQKEERDLAQQWVSVTVMIEIAWIHHK